MGKTVISVVIPTKDRVDETLKCLDSILKQTLLPNEIFIVDSSETPGLYSFLKRKFPQDISKIRYIHSTVSNNAARNIGIRQSLGDIVFFFDDDVVLDKVYIKEVVKIFTKDSEGKMGGVMGEVTNVGKKHSRSLREILRGRIRHLFYLSYYGNGKFKPSGSPTWVQSENRITRTEFLSGCMMAYRRSVLNEFTFDEELGKLSGYCFMDDVDFSYRVSRKYTLVYTPYAKLEHHPSRSRKTEYDPVLRKRQKVFNHFYLFRKNMPKRFSNVFAFALSLFGLLIIISFQRNPKEIIGWLKGIIDIVLS